MDKPTNIYIKLQKCRVSLQKEKMKKSGKNSYSNYDYFELGDFLPKVNELMLENGLTALFFFEKDKARLHIIDTDNPADKIVFFSPVSMAQLKNCHEIQNIGATQTYMRRYLYVMAFEIAEHDAVENIEKDDSAETASKLIDKDKLTAIKSLIKSTNTDEAQFLEFYHVDVLEDLTVELWMRAMKSLEKKLQKQKSGTTKSTEELDLLGGK